MAEEGTNGKRDILKRELGGRGLVVRVSTSRDGASLVARLEVTEAATDRTVAKFVGVADVDDLDILIGVDAPENAVREFLAQLFGAADALRGLAPVVTIREE